MHVLTAKHHNHQRKPVTQAVRKRYQLKKPHGTQISIPAASVEMEVAATPLAPAQFRVQRRRRSCTKTAFSASYNASLPVYSQDETQRYIPKSMLLKIVSLSRPRFLSPFTKSNTPALKIELTMSHSRYFDSSN